MSTSRRRAENAVLAAENTCYGSRTLLLDVGYLRLPSALSRKHPTSRRAIRHVTLHSESLRDPRGSRATQGRCHTPACRVADAGRRNLAFEALEREGVRRSSRPGGCAREVRVTHDPWHHRLAAAGPAALDATPSRGVHLATRDGSGPRNREWGRADRRA